MDRGEPKTRNTPRGDRPRQRPPAAAPQRSRARDTEAPISSRLTAADVDAGWDDDELSPDLPAEPQQNSRWGDDDDAPSPDITLAADLPQDQADDPDPATAQLAALDHCDLPEHDAHNVVGIKFSRSGKIYEFDAGEASYQRDETVVVEGERGQRLGTVAIPSVREPHGARALKKVLRHPNARDQRTLERNDDRAHEALAIAREEARNLNLSVKVYRAECSFGGGKVTVYYSAEQKVDSRDLARALGQRFQGRLELRQTGVRDEAKATGGIGSCGRELCCTTFLPSFSPVSIKMAKDQNLVLNPTKVSGQCGRLKCCLVYEQSMYAEMRKGLPRVGKRVVTTAGEGRVTEVDVLHGKIRVSLVHGEFQVFTADEVQPMFPSQQQESPK